MTLSAVGYILAAAILLAGTVLSARLPSNRRMTALAGSVVVAAAVGWFSWLLGTSA